MSQETVAVQLHPVQYEKTNNNKRRRLSPVEEGSASMRSYNTVLESMIVEEEENANPSTTNTLSPQQAEDALVKQDQIEFNSTAAMSLKQRVDNWVTKMDAIQTTLFGDLSGAVQIFQDACNLAIAEQKERTMNMIQQLDTTISEVEQTQGQVTKTKEGFEVLGSNV